MANAAVKQKERSAVLSECGLFIELCEFEDGTFQVSIHSKEDVNVQIVLARSINMLSAIESAAMDLERAAKLPYLIRLPQEADSP